MVVGDTVIKLPVVPVFHVTVPSHPAAVNVTLSPAQMLGLEAEAALSLLFVLTVIFTVFEFGLKQSFTLHLAV